MMNPVEFASQSASALPSQVPKHACHILWDIESVGIPEGVSEVYVVNSLQSLVEKECQGFLESFVVICKDGAVSFDTKRGLQESGVVVEEINSPKLDIADIFILTRLLGLALSISSQPAQHARPILILISSDRDFARALSLLRRSGIFRDVVLLHNTDASEAIKSSVTYPIDWRLFLNLAATRPRSPRNFPAVQGGRTSSSALAPSSAPAALSKSQVLPSRTLAAAQTQPAASGSPAPVVPAHPYEGIGILSLYPDKTSGNERATSEQDWRARKQEEKKKPTPTPATTAADWRSESQSQSQQRPVAGAAGALGQGAGHYRPPHQRERDTPPRPTASILQTQAPPAAAQPVPASTAVAATAPAAASAVAPTASVWQASLTPVHKEKDKDKVEQQSESEQRTPGSTQAETASTSAAAARPTAQPQQAISPNKNGDKNRRPDKQTLACRLFGHVMAVCAEEKIIPRESVIRSKLEDTAIWDTKKSLCPAGLRSWPSMHMEFETWLETVISLKVCVCVGVSPQRVLWPAPPAARFECADYFRPQERLSAEQMTALVDFLSRDRPSGHEVDRGRYGFANYLKTYGPAFVREMPRGYVVELVQLLLNKNFLQFRKGKVSFRPAAAGRWRLALESVLAPGISRLDYGADAAGATPDEDDETGDELGSVSEPGSGRQSQSQASTPSPATRPLQPRPSAREVIEQQLARRNSMPARPGSSEPVRNNRSSSLPESKRPSVRDTTTGTTPLDLEDPVEVLAVKCAETLPAGSDTSALGVGMGALAAKSGPKSLPAFPLYHFEKSAHLIAASTPPNFQFSALYVPTMKAPASAETLPVNLRPQRFRSTKKAKKLEAQQEAALRALESTFWEEPIPEEFHKIDKTKLSSGALDDPVVVLDRLLVSLEQAPLVYSMDSDITQHGGGSRTMWTSGVQLTLRPRPAQLTTGTLAPEEAHSDVTKEIPEDVPSVRYPTIKWTASQAKKFDAKAIVAAHVLQVLDKSRHRYPLLFQSPSDTPKPASQSAPVSPTTSPALGPAASPAIPPVTWAAKAAGKSYAKTASAPTTPSHATRALNPVVVSVSPMIQPQAETRQRMSSIPGGPSTRADISIEQPKPLPSPPSVLVSPQLQPVPHMAFSPVTSPLVTSSIPAPVSALAETAPDTADARPLSPILHPQSPQLTLSFDPNALLDELERNMESSDRQRSQSMPTSVSTEAIWKDHAFAQPTATQPAQAWTRSLHELATQAEQTDTASTMPAETRNATGNGNGSESSSQSGEDETKAINSGASCVCV